MEDKKEIPFNFYLANGEILISGGKVALEHHPYYIYRNKHNQKHPLFYIDEFGFRGRTLNKDAPTKIIILGSSSTFGLYSSDERTWVSILEKIYNRYSNQAIRVINAGVIGYLTKQIFHYLVDLLALYKPKFIIVSAGWTDWFDIFYNQRQKNRFSYHSLFQYIENKLITKTNYKINNFNIKLIEKISYYVLQELLKINNLSKAYNCDFLFIFNPILKTTDINTIYETKICENVKSKYLNFFEYQEYFINYFKQVSSPWQIEKGGFIYLSYQEKIEIEGIKFVDFVHYSEKLHHWLAIKVYALIKNKENNENFFGKIIKRKRNFINPDINNLQKQKLLWDELNIYNRKPFMLKIKSSKYSQAHIKIEEVNSIIVNRLSSEQKGNIEKNILIPFELNYSSALKIRVVDPVFQKELDYKIISVKEVKGIKILEEKLDLYDDKYFDKECWLPPEVHWVERIHFRWVLGGKSWLEFKPYNNPNWLKIKIMPLSETQTVWMLVSIDNIEIASIPLEFYWTNYWINIPEFLLPLEGRILISFFPLWTPKDLKIAPDDRILPAAIHSLSYTSVSNIQ